MYEYIFLYIFVHVLNTYQNEHHFMHSLILIYSGDCTCMSIFFIYNNDIGDYVYLY
jgi:hypothetical protein